MMVRPKKIVEQSKMFNVQLPLSQHQVLKDRARSMSQNLDRQVSVADLIRVSLDLNLDKTCQLIEGQGPVFLDTSEKQNALGSPSKFLMSLTRTG